jgi:hypothetical protein
MSTREIPKTEWKSFFDEFSTKHHGWVVTVEEIGGELGAQEEANKLPLVGIAADVKDRESQMTLILGGRPGADVNRIIPKPIRVWSRQDEGEEHDAIEIEAEDDFKVILRFSAVPAEHQLPEHV